MRPARSATRPRDRRTVKLPDPRRRRAETAFAVVTALACAAAPLLGGCRTSEVVSQALPVFAIAPLLVIWFGFGLASKIVMAGLIIYFPVAAAFLDGLTEVVARHLGERTPLHPVADDPGELVAVW